MRTTPLPSSRLANLSLNIANLALFDKFTVGQMFYVDFTEVPCA